LAKPGLSGLSSNSSEQMAQVLIGKGIVPCYRNRHLFAELRRTMWADAA
jgi:hypothetical protein